MDIIAADAKIPALGLGTWQVTGEDCVNVVRRALDAGYRHVDTAQMYGNESEVGAGIAASSVSREDIFLTTKLNNDRHSPEQVRRSLEDSLRRLDTGHVDLFLIHWPVELDMLEDTIDAMEKCRADGMTRHIGVSNFTADQVNRAADHTHVVTNQVEFHPFLDQSTLLGLAKDRGMAVTAYSPLAQGRVLEDDTLREIAADREVSPVHVALRWLLDHDNVIAIPRSSDAEHAIDNLKVLEMAPLTDDERNRINDLPKDDRIINPPFAPDWD